MTFIKINGFNYCITKEGRFRRHWRNDFRTIRTKKYGKCDKCGKYRILTEHHEPPLRIQAGGNKIFLWCPECHEEYNHNERINNKLPKQREMIKSCMEGHCTYLVDGNIFCKVCNRVVTKLERISYNEYKTI